MRRGNPQTSNIHMTQQMTTKVAPAYDGRTSFFAFEDAIDDWCDITELEAEKRGPALRNRPEGDASQYKRLLDRDLLRDPNEGVNYFKRFLRPTFIKGAQTVFLYRFMQFMKHNRGTMDLQRWMTRFQLTANRLIESWMDLIPDLDIQAPEVIATMPNAEQLMKNNSRICQDLQPQLQVLNHMLSYLGMTRCPDKYLYNSTMQEDSSKELNSLE